VLKFKPNSFGMEKQLDT